jgi:hypothetical protein
MTDQFLKSLIEPAKRKLRILTRRFKVDVSTIEPLIDKLIKIGYDQTVEVLESTPFLKTSTELCVNHIVTIAYQHFEFFISQEDKIEELRRLIRIYGSIFIVGAGISFGSDMPLTRHLKPILDFIGVSDYNSLIKANKTRIFKMKFKELSDGKPFNQSHTALSKNLSIHIKQIICLNWDDLIERAGEKLGKSVSTVNEDEMPNSKDNFLWKFHGDVRKIKDHNNKGKGGWIFPDEGGYVFESFKQFVSKYYYEEIFVLVIVGFSERDKAISEVIGNLNYDPGVRPTYRIGFDFQKNTDNEYLIGPAEYILKRIF